MIKIDSNLSRVNMKYYVKHHMPIARKQFFRIIFQNPEYGKTHCIDRNVPFHFACRKWFSKLN